MMLVVNWFRSLKQYTGFTLQMDKKQWIKNKRLTLLAYKPSPLYNPNTLKRSLVDFSS